MNKLEPGLLIPVDYLRTVDGDTIEVEIRRKFKVRLRDINVIEKDKPKGKEATNFVATLLHYAKKILVFIPTNDPYKLMDVNSFERIVGDIYIDEDNLKDILVAKGFDEVS